jgi:hypothetical protein
MMDREAIQRQQKSGDLMSVPSWWNTNLVYSTQASPGAEPLLFCTLNYAYALSLKGLNETHLHIYILPYESY